MTPEGFRAVRDYHREMSHPILANTEDGTWDFEELWQMKYIDGHKCFMFNPEAGSTFSRGIAGTLLRGQTSCSSLMKDFIRSRMHQGLNLWCQHQGIYLQLLMAAICTTWPGAGAAMLREVLGPEFLCNNGTGPAAHLRRDTPLIFREPLTALPLSRWDCQEDT